ncbi:MAG TPA: LPXTG cell wall anchor domain-containing protein, partial [Slackia equolifaciens]|nr:LPXTG cell wall anchor domain-containing protein [Slackia equolifaciens]
FSYVWLRDGAVVEGATDAKLSTDVPGSYTVIVTANGDGVLASDGAESDAVLCSVEPHEAAKWSTDESGHWKVCSICGADFERAEHSWGSWTVVQEPEVNAEGKRECVCSVCGFVESEAIPALEDEPSEKDPSAADDKKGGSSEETLPATGDRGFAPFAALGAASLLTIAVSAVMRRRLAD